MAEAQKALTKEDLIYILQSLFKIADEQDNVLQRTDNGLYVKDEFSAIRDDLDAHVDDNNVHITSTIRNILDKLSVDENDELLYDNRPITTIISDKHDNALKIDENGGMFVRDYHADLHIENEDIHVTKEQKDDWSKALDESKKYTIEEIGKIPLTKMEVVTILPTENISSETLYFLIVYDEDEEKYGFSLYIYSNDKWWPMIIPQEKLEALLKVDLHKHENKSVIDLFGVDETGQLLYNGEDLFNVACLDDPTNAAKMVGNKLYIKDFTQELKSIETCSVFAKVNLYSEEISDSGKYQLKDDINNFNLIMIEYYYKPDKEGEPNGCAKTAVIDTDVLNFLYDKAMDYMLEYGYGIMTSNSKIRMHEDKIWVDYYNNVCIYRITGIRKATPAKESEGEE